MVFWRADSRKRMKRESAAPISCNGGRGSHQRPSIKECSIVIQASVTYYNNSYRHAAARMKGAALGDDLKWAGDIVARFSILSDPVITTFLSDIVPTVPGLRVLDIGCGSGLFF
jgi:2-polyprenyl-3-methyl-5-hydroxy-6-metoxy-1,4-benzoquinol methylase